MSDISTEYRGYTIRYGGNSEEWYCHEVGFSSATLSKVKARIDKMYLDLRKKSSVDVCEISRGTERYLPSCIPSKIIEYVRTKVERSYAGGGCASESHIVAVFAQRNGRGKPARRDADIKDLMQKSPEAAEAWEKYVSAHKDYVAAHRVAEAAYRAIPRVTLEDVAALKAIKTSEDEKGNG